MFKSIFTRNIVISTIGTFIMVMLLIPSGCKDDRALRDRLDRLEALVEADPYLAMEALDSIPAKNLGNPELEARHILLTARGRHRCYIDETNDSAISKAVKFYTDNPSVSAAGVSRKMLALYQQGVIRENDGNYLLALDSFLKAETEALMLEDHYFLGYIYRHLCLLYENIHAGKESVYYGKKSYEEYLLADTEANVAYASGELGYAYAIYCQYDSARIWADKCLSLPYCSTDRKLRADILSLAGESAFRLGQNADAIGYYSELQNMGEKYFQKYDAWHFARVLHSNGDSQRARQICRDYLENDSDTIGVPYEILYAQGDIEGAFKAIKGEHEREKIHTTDYSRQNLTRALAEFREQEISEQIEQHRRDMILWVLATCLFVALVIIVIMVMSRRFKRSRKELISLMTTMETLNEDLRHQLRDKDSIISEKENENAHAMQSYYTSLESQIQQIDEMTTLFREPTSTTVNRTLLKRITRLKEQFRDPKFLAKMEQEVNCFHGDIIRRLREEFPEMKEEEIRLFLYQVCGFSGRTITFLTGEELTTLYPRRSRLKSRIAKSDVASRADFLKYFR